MTTVAKEKETAECVMDKAKQFLSSAGRYDELLRLRREQRDYMINVARSLCTPTYALGPRFYSGFADKEKVLCEIATLNRHIQDDIDNLVDSYARVKSAIAQVANKEYRILLEMRYLTYKTWDEIAQGMNYSQRHIVRIHVKALQALCETDFFRTELE
jgi:tRNA(Met) C34 N-acetyltransferase TmcA